jgi:hypothetical protein
LLIADDTALFARAAGLPDVFGIKYQKLEKIFKVKIKGKNVFSKNGEQIFAQWKFFQWLLIYFGQFLIVQK